MHADFADTCAAVHWLHDASALQLGADPHQDGTTSTERNGGYGCNEIEVVHGGSGLRDWFAGCGRCPGLFRLLHAPKRGLYAVGNTLGKRVRPFVDCLVGNANCGSGFGDRSAEQLDGFVFMHATLNHSSVQTATIVTVGSVSCPDMDSYKDRLAAAMGGEVPRSAVIALARELGVSPQAIQKVLDGKSNAFTAANNVKAARFLRVSSDWLATGEGEMEQADLWPFPLVDRSRLNKLGPEARGYIQSAMNQALRELDAAQRDSQSGKPEGAPQTTATNVVEVSTKPRPARQIDSPFSAAREGRRPAKNKHGG